MIDFDRVTRDPNEPKKLLAAFDSCDHLHPSDAGYTAMANAIDLDLFKPATSRINGVTSMNQHHLKAAFTAATAEPFLNISRRTRRAPPSHRFAGPP